MPIAHVNGVDLYYEETGQGTPLVTLNIEEPGLFNLHLGEFLAAVDSGRWAGWSR